MKDSCGTCYNIYAAFAFGHMLAGKWCSKFANKRTASHYLLLRTLIPSRNPCGRDTPFLLQYSSNIFSSCSVSLTSTRTLFGLSVDGRPLFVSGMLTPSLCQHLNYNLLPPLIKYLFTATNYYLLNPRDRFLASFFAFSICSNSFT